MIPSAETSLNQDIEFVEPSSFTFFFDIYNNVVIGKTDDLKAMEQAIYLILSIERYKYEILPWSYGVELEDLFGMPISYVIPEVERRIVEALMQDTRITAVDSFEFEIISKGKLFVMFKVTTVYGGISLEKVVDF